MFRKVWKVSKIVLLGVLAVLVLGAVGLFGYRAYRQHQNEQLMAVTAPNGIDEGRYVPVHGGEQWVSIRGQDRNNPVILFLHGGPGGANGPFEDVLMPLEKDFTIVHWDQPGSGRSYIKAGRVIDPKLTVERVAQDGIEVAAFVRRHLGKDRVILLGMSWGTVIGVHMAKAQPDLFHAYVGTGQVVEFKNNELVAYQRVLAKARARGDHEATKELEAIGPPPYSSVDKFRAQRKWAGIYEPGTPGINDILVRAFTARGYSLSDSTGWVGGFLGSGEHFMGRSMDGPIWSHDLRSLGTEFAIPIFVLQGAEDDFTPAELAKAYVESLQGPHVEYVAIQNAGHNALWTHTGELLKVLNEKVRPLAAGNAGS